MGSFGNYVGATMGTSTNEEGNSGAVYDNSWVTNSNYPKRAALVGDNGEFVQKHYGDKEYAPTITGYTPNSDLLGEVPGLLSDNSTYQEMQDELNGPSGETGGTNWENHTFVNMRTEKEALEKSKISDLATAWTQHGDDLKTNSENFKKAVKNHLLGHWSGESAAAAESASQQVTKTSIYDFTPSSEAISNRLKALKGAFDSIVSQFPNHANDQLIDNGEFDKKELEQRIKDFNDRYHLDDGGRLRNNSDGYVTAADALKELEQIKTSVTDYRKAVDLFENIYNPTAVAAVENFPTLPPPPNMKYGDAGAPTGPGGPGTGPGTGPGAGPGTGPGGTPPIGTPNFGKPAIDKPGGIEPIKPGNTDIPNTDKPTNPTNPTNPTGLDGLTDPIKSAMDTATTAAKDAMGQAMDAAKNAAQGGQPPIGAGGPPEGVLGLGPKGLGGAGAGSGGAGSGGGAPLRGLANSLPTGTPATAAVKAPAGATGAGAGAGLGSGAGSPGAGAPAAGQRGDQNGKGHQVNKALRRKKNGKDVIGNADAAVPVVGAQDDQEPAESSQTDQSEFRRRIPQRGGTTWQPNSAVQGGSPRPARTQHPGSVDQLADQ